MKDTFEDAPDITPRSHSPSTTRHLTERRDSSTATADNKPSDPSDPSRLPDSNIVTGDETAESREEGAKSLQHELDEALMDDVNLDEGQCQGPSLYTCLRGMDVSAKQYLHKSRQDTRLPTPQTITRSTFLQLNYKNFMERMLR